MGAISAFHTLTVNGTTRALEFVLGSFKAVVNVRNEVESDDSDVF